MVGSANYILSTPKRLYDFGTDFIKNHPVLTLTTLALTSAAVGVYFSANPSAFIRNLPQPPLSVSSFSEPEVKTDSDKGIFLNKITKKFEYDQIENPTLYGQVVNYIKTRTFAAVKTTPQTRPLSEKYEFSILGNLLYYPIYVVGCGATALIVDNAIFSISERRRSSRNPFYAVSARFFGAGVGSFILDQLRQRFLGV